MDQETSKAASDISASAPYHAATNTSNQSLVNNMWDAFEHILMFISLCVLASSIGLFLHHYVDKFFSPIKIVSGYDFGLLGAASLPMLISSLIVSYPLFAFFFIHTTKKTLENQHLVNLSARKLLIYITLIVTFLYMVFKIISLIYEFITGNFSINLVLHFAVTVFINGFIFAYYLLEVRKEKHHA